VGRGGGEKPGEALDIGGDSGNQVAALIVVEKGFGKPQGTLDQFVLDIKDDSSFKAGEIKLLRQTG
jgi:hypothetical protein